MIKAIIIDDEPKAIQALLWELGGFKDEITIAETFSKGTEAIDFLSENRDIDAVFLDVNMPMMDGFTFLQQLGDKSENYSIVITSAYQKYAIEAIKNNVVDYLLKPFDQDDLRSTIDKINKHRKIDKTDEKFENLLVEFHETINQKKITINADGRMIFINPSDILYLESDGNYCSIHLVEKQKIFVTKNLKEFGELLDSRIFFRIHNSYIVNLNKIKEYHRTEGCLLMENNEKIPVSRNKKSEFMDLI